MTDDWPEIKARLENEIALWPVGEHEGWDGFVLDIRAALQRVDELERDKHDLEITAASEQREKWAHQQDKEHWRERAEAAEAKLARVVEAVLAAEEDIRALGFEAHPAVTMRLDRLVRGIRALAAVKGE